MLSNHGDFCIHYVNRERHDSNLKNSKFAEATKHTEEYLGASDVNIIFSQNIFSKAEKKIL